MAWDAGDWGRLEDGFSLVGGPLTLGKAPGKASFPPSLPCVQAAAANFWQGLLYSTLQVRLGTAKQPYLGEKLLELAGWQVPRPWPQCATIDWIAPGRSFFGVLATVHTDWGPGFAS